MDSVPVRSSAHSRRRMLGGTVTALAAPALLAACGAQTAGQPGLSQEAKPTTLEWFGKLKGISQSDVDAFAQQYKTARPNVTLNVTSVSNTAEGKAKLASYAAAGTPVDVISTFAGIPTLRTLNGGYSLNDYVKRDKFDTSRFGTIYNVPPMWGAKWTSEDGRTVLTDKPEMLQAWTEYYDMVVKDRSTLFSPGAPAELGGENPSFLTGKGATLTICCAVPTTTVLFKDQGLDWAFIPFPKAREAVADICGTVIAIWSQTKAPDESWRFLRWSIEEGRLANLEQRMPSQTKAIEPYVQKYYGSMPDVRPNLLLQAPDHGNPPDALWQSPAADQADAAITAAFAEVGKGNKTVPAALGELKPQLQSLLDQYRD